MKFHNQISVLAIFWVLLASALPLAAAQLKSAKGGQVRAFLVGINKYAFVNPLYGSVADVRDIEGALKSSGVPQENIRLLVDGEATRANFVAQMEKMLADSHPGDLVILSFSGHGMRVPELPQWKGRDPGGLSEQFVLAGYQTTGAGTREGVMNKEIKAWLSRFDAKAIDVIFIADTCHGGGLARSAASQEAPDLTIRLIKDAPRDGTSQFTPINITGRELAVDVQDLPHVSFIAGADRQHVVPEFPIPNQPTRRGALSYAFARAIEGRAGEAGSPVTTRAQLFTYALQIVSQVSKEQQIIDFLPAPSDPAAFAAPLLRFSGDAGSAATEPPKVAAVDADVVKIFAARGDGQGLADIKAAAKFAVTPNRAEASLIWDSAVRKIANATGDIIVENIGAAQVGGVVDRTFAIGQIDRLSVLHPQTIGLRAGGKRYSTKDTPEIQASGLKGQHLIVFNLAGDGQIQMLSPPKGASDLVSEAQWTYPPYVTEPYGEDRVVAISSPVAMPDLAAWLWSKNGQLAAGLLPERLAAMLAANSAVRIGTVGLFTGP